MLVAVLTGIERSVVAVLRPLVVALEAVVSASLVGAAAKAENIRFLVRRGMAFNARYQRQMVLIAL